MRSPVILLVSLGCLLATSACAQTAGVSVTNAAGKKTAYSLADLKSFPQVSLDVIGEDGAAHHYTGVDLYDLLSRSDVPFGKEVRRKTLNSYLRVSAADQYSVLYALAEVDTFLSEKKMILAYLKDRQPLPVNFGPLQLIVTGEKKHARLIRQVTAFDIREPDSN